MSVAHVKMMSAHTSSRSRVESLSLVCVKPATTICWYRPTSTLLTPRTKLDEAVGQEEN
jgi:hypothetical protein